jgi:hypothetical protein
MRLVRVLLSLVLVAFGVVAAAFVMMLALVARLFGGSSTVRVHTSRNPGGNTQSRATTRDRQGDVIDIESTPVKPTARIGDESASSG